MMWSNAIAPGTLTTWSGRDLYLTYGYHPVVKLRGDVKVIRGTGTEADPFII